ncbi:MAG TPA: WD40 repeat domain-containing protein, partial [Gemmataceae bacterium]
MMCVRGVWLTVGSFLVLIAGNLHGADVKSPRTDLYGDPLPPRVVARMGTIQMRHVQAIFTFSPDGKDLISFGPGGEVRFWDVAVGKLHHRQQLWRSTERFFDIGFREWTSQMTLSPDGATVARLVEDEVVFFDTRTGKLCGRLALGPPGDNVSREIEFSSDGKMLIVYL